uniref:Uncharacterized protein n=1 Tax=Oryza meridionalis TaxID=40149 RepID=A0A0E0DA81_9ORYZ
MASSSVGVGGGLKLMRARGLLVFSEMMALLLICLVMMSSSVNTCQGRSLLAVSVGEEKVPHFEQPVGCFEPPCR